MKNRMTELITLVQKLPEQKINEAIESINRILDKPVEVQGEDGNDGDGNGINTAITTRRKHSSKKPTPSCPHCKSSSVVRHGKARAKQRYLCKECNKTFVPTTMTTLSDSHYGEAVWKQVVEDTINGESLKRTANKLNISKNTAFYMRHKILMSMESKINNKPTVLSGVCELDETYILESMKGTALPDGYWRKARKHGARSKNKGLNAEHVCCCTGVQRDGGAVSLAVNRSTASSQDLINVFGKHIKEDSLILYDGAKSYMKLGSECKCGINDVFDPIHEEVGDSKFYNINTVNSFHSQIKLRIEREYRGVATKYLNRYNALVTLLFRNDGDLVEEVYKLVTSREGDKKVTYQDVRCGNLLLV